MAGFLIILGMILATLISLALLKRDRTISEPLCPTCHYVLIGIKRPECPECGADLNLTAIIVPGQQTSPGAVITGLAWTLNFPWVALLGYVPIWFVSTLLGFHVWLGMFIVWVGMLGVLVWVYRPSQTKLFRITWSQFQSEIWKPSRESDLSSSDAELPAK